MARADECPNLLDSIRSEFQQMNPRIQDIQILDSKRKHSDYWIVARGIVEGSEFNGSFEDELFGVFIVNGRFDSVMTVIDMMPTPRWNDYEMWISDHELTNVTVSGHGATYEDQPLEKTYQEPKN